MIEFAKTGAGISTLLGLLGFTVSLCISAYGWLLNHRIQRLKLVPEDKRAELEKKWINRYGLQGKDVSGEQRTQLILKEISSRAFTTNLVIVVCAAVFLVALSIATIYLPEPTKIDEFAAWRLDHPHFRRIQSDSAPEWCDIAPGKDYHIFRYEDETSRPTYLYKFSQDGDEARYIFDTKTEGYPPGQSFVVFTQPKNNNVWGGQNRHGEALSRADKGYFVTRNITEEDKMTAAASK
jgi:hypothetical protein